MGAKQTTAELLWKSFCRSSSLHPHDTSWSTAARRRTALLIKLGATWYDTLGGGEICNLGSTAMIHVFVPETLSPIKNQSEGGKDVNKWPIQDQFESLPAFLKLNHYQLPSNVVIHVGHHFFWTWGKRHRTMTTVQHSRHSLSEVRVLIWCVSIPNWTGDREWKEEGNAIPWWHGVDQLVTSIMSWLKVPAAEFRHRAVTQEQKLQRKDQCLCQKNTPLFYFIFCRLLNSIFLASSATHPPPPPCDAPFVVVRNGRTAIVVVVVVMMEMITSPLSGPVMAAQITSDCMSTIRLWR